MAEFASPEYVKEALRRLRENSYWREFGGRVTASFTVVIEAEPDMGIWEDRVVGFRVVEGEVAEVWVGERRETDFTLSGKYGEWVRLVLGRANPMKFLLRGRIKVSGDLAKLLGLARLAMPLVDVFRSIPTRFHGEYSRYSSNRDP